MSEALAQMKKSEVVDKWEAAKTRAANLSKKLGGTGIKPTAMALAGGGAAFYVERAIADIDALKGNYRKGFAMAAVGHVLKKKAHDLGTGLVFLGGYLLAKDYQAQKDADKAAAGGAAAQIGGAKGFGLDDVSGFVDAAEGLVNF